MAILLHHRSYIETLLYGIPGANGILPLISRKRMTCSNPIGHIIVVRANHREKIMDEYRQTLESITGIPFSEGNRLTVLKNGIEIFPAMLEAIDGAKCSIDMVTYVYWKGKIAHRFAESLARKARQGVAVRLILDAFGGYPMPKKLLKIMRKKGVAIRWFRPMGRIKLWNINNRTHRKVLVCDGKIGFTGGVGIAEEWEGNARNPSEWRDTHFRVEGPSVYGLHAAFLENWIESEGELDLTTDRLEPIPVQGDIPLQLLHTNSSVRWSENFVLFSALLLMARRTIRITTAYFDPDAPMISVFKRVRSMGVSIQILVPGQHIDIRAAKIAAETNYQALLDMGVDIWQYQRTMLHAKVILIDDGVACVGSANFNQRSLKKDNEVNLLILDSAIVRLLIQHFQEDLLFAKQLSTESWRKRSALQRMKEILVLPLKENL